MQSPPPAKRWQPLWRKNIVGPWWEQCKALLTQRENWYTLLTAAIVFLAPTNLFYTFWEQGSYVHGLQIDYLLGKLYLSQILLILLVGLWLTDKKNWKNFIGSLNQPRVIVFIVAFFALGVRQIFTAEPLISLLHWVSLCLLGLFALIIRTESKIISQRIVTWAIVLTVVFQSVVGLAQLLLQHEVIGYSFLGEPELSLPIGIAHIIFAGRDTLLPYGTTAHPNVLAGFLAVYCIWLLKVVKDQKNWWLLLPTSLGLVTLALTTSISGMLTFGLGLWWLFFSKFLLNSKRFVLLYLGLIIVFTPLILYSLSTVLPDNHSVLRRNYLQQAGIQIFATQPLVGTGLQTVTRFVEMYSPENEVVRFTQPPHHAGILLLAETGILGLCLMFMIRRHLPLTSAFLLAPIISLDHYVWTLWPGSLLALLCILILWEFEQFN